MEYVDSGIDINVVFSIQMLIRRCWMTMNELDFIGLLRRKIQSQCSIYSHCPVPKRIARMRSFITISSEVQAGTTPLMCAVSAGRKQNVVLLLEAGANVNLENENKETVLHMTKSMLRMSSLNTDNSDILELFIDQITDIDKKVRFFFPSILLLERLWSHCSNESGVSGKP